MAVNTEKEDMIQEQVIRAAQQLYQQHGLHKVTMEDVARAVGKGKSSLYYYYKSKEEIFDAVIGVEIREIIAEIAKAVSKAETLEEKIQAFCMAKFRISRKRRTTFNAMDIGLNPDEMNNYVRNKQAVQKQFRQAETVFFKQIIMTATERGEIPAMDEKQLDMTVFVMLGSFRGLKREIVEEGYNQDEQDAADTIASLMMKGLKN